MEGCELIPDMTDAELQAEIEKQLAALGVQSRPPLEDAVFDALVAGWKAGGGKPPVLADIARAVGARPNSISGALNRLQRAGRVYYKRRGEWVPVVV